MTPLLLGGAPTPAPDEPADEGPGEAEIGSDYGILLPDLAVSPPAELYIVQTGAGRELRFSTTVGNIGEGPLEILGRFDEERELAFATQLIHRREGAPIEHELGTLDYDGGHGHWHTEDFVSFELWSYAEDGALEELLASTGKIGFCLLDFTTIDPAPEHVATVPLFDECHWSRQGLSPGWQETYAAWLPGQALDITRVPDGRYVIQTVLDPENRIIDAYDVNETVAVFIELAGTSIQVLTPAADEAQE
jgi:hypothetical protein